MSRFLSGSTRALEPYAPGEQPRGTRYIKLNTNENPYPPAPAVSEALQSFDSGELRLYPDPDASALRAEIADYYAINPNQVFVGGGSDEVLAYAFMAFFDRGGKVYFPDITYGFYKVYADLFGLSAVQIPLREDFTIGIEDYFGLDGHIFLANPNAPTGIYLSPAEIELILQKNRDGLVVIDEAYIDFANGGSCVKLIGKYDNLLVVQTFSKSRSLAGMRLGMGFGNAGLIGGLERIKYSFNPYNLDRVSIDVGIASIKNANYMREMIGKIIATRERVSESMQALGFEALPSQANFLFARSNRISGADLYARLKENGILVRYFDKDRIRGFVRITIGSDEEMDVFLTKLEEIL